MNYRYYKIDFAEICHKEGFIAVPEQVIETVGDYCLFDHAFNTEFMIYKIPSYYIDDWVEDWDYTEIDKDEFESNASKLSMVLDICGTPREFEENTNKDLVINKL